MRYKLLCLLLLVAIAGNGQIRNDDRDSAAKYYRLANEFRVTFNNDLDQYDKYRTLCLLACKNGLNSFQFENEMVNDLLFYRIDSLEHELDLQRKLLQFNTDMGNLYIRKVDSLALRVGTGFWFRLEPFYPDIDHGFWRGEWPRDLPAISDTAAPKAIKLWSSDSTLSIIYTGVAETGLDTGTTYHPVTPKKKKKK